MTKMKHAWFPVTLSFVLTHSSDRLNQIKSVWRVLKHETQSYRESCVFHFSHFELYFSLHSCVLSAFQQHLLQFPTIIFQLYTNTVDSVVGALWSACTQTPNILCYSPPSNLPSIGTQKIIATVTGINEFEKKSPFCSILSYWHSIY